MKYKLLFIIASLVTTNLTFSSEGLIPTICKDESTFTGITKEAKLQVSINKFKGGYLFHDESKIELQMRINLLDGFIETSSSYWEGGFVGHRSDTINLERVNFDILNGQEFDTSTLTRTYSMADIHQQMSLLNLGFLRMEVNFYEYDYLFLEERINFTQFTLGSSQDNPYRSKFLLKKKSNIVTETIGPTHDPVEIEIQFSILCDKTSNSQYLRP